MENRIVVEKSLIALAVTRRRGIKREELVGERNRREGNNVINITYRGLINRVNFMSRRSYERDEDWLVTCPVCNGTGTTGEGVSRKRCPKCDGAGKLKR